MWRRPWCPMLTRQLLLLYNPCENRLNQKSSFICWWFCKSINCVMFQNTFNTSTKLILSTPLHAVIPGNFPDNNFFSPIVVLSVVVGYFLFILSERSPGSLRFSWSSKHLSSEKLTLLRAIWPEGTLIFSLKIILYFLSLRKICQTGLYLILDTLIRFDTLWTVFRNKNDIFSAPIVLWNLLRIGKIVGLKWGYKNVPFRDRGTIIIISRVMVRLF